LRADRARRSVIHLAGRALAQRSESRPPRSSGGGQAGQDAPPEELENPSSSDYSTASQDALDERIAATPYVSEQDRQNRIDNAGGGEVR